MIKYAVIRMISVYKRWISPMLPPACRFYPSCSNYAVTALEKYGLWKGLALTGIRLLKCQPLHPGGYDPVR